MMVAIICEKTGWTYDEFLEQPQWLIETILAKENEDRKAEIEELRKIKK